MSKPPASAKVASGTSAAAPVPTGCCNIILDDGTGQQFEHITEEECRLKAMALDAAAHWVAGDCA